jgi:hypothetical protein
VIGKKYSIFGPFWEIIRREPQELSGKGNVLGEILETVT